MFRNVIWLLGCAMLCFTAAVASAAEPQTDEADHAIEYIVAAQNADGGFPGFGTDSSSGSTLDAMFALIAAGIDPATAIHGGNSPIDYLETQSAAYSADPGAAAKLAIGVALTGGDLNDFGGVDLRSIMDGAVDPATGAYGLDTFDECFYLLALAAAGDDAPENVYEHLHSSRASDGGWEFTPGEGSDSNTTAMVVQALIASRAPPDDHAVAVGLGYLATAQNGDGGFGFHPGDDSDPNSTALVVQAVAAARQNIDVGGRWAPGGQTPLDYLTASQNAETGAVQYFGEDSLFATYQAVPALLLAPFPDLTSRDLDFSEPTPAATPTASGLQTVAAASPTSAVGELPSAGGGAHRDSIDVWPVGALLVAGGGVTAAAFALRKRS